MRLLLHAAPVGLLFCAFLAAACSPEKDLMADAKRQQDQGETDGAIATLEVLKTKHPDSEAAKQVPTLAETWLLEAADASRDPNVKRPRLQAALKWNPESGKAQLRLCQLLVDEKKIEEAKSCLDKDLQGKAPEPELEKRIRTALAEVENAATLGERERLAKSNRPQHWKALIERFPQSDQAKEAKAKLKRLESLCDDLPRFGDEARAEFKRQQTDFKKDIDKALAEKVEGLRVDLLEGLGRAAARRASELKELAGQVADHRLKPGEEKAQQILRKALLLQSDSLADLADALERDAIENLDSYQRGAEGVLKRWLGGIEREAKSVEKLLEDSKTACAPEDSSPTDAKP
ncbi:MAG: hypothetical protein H6716_21055 [Polyangiaceae bacterium]|nr:hypothetical protein [Polyangiaceae bacterium]